jgi:surface antigen
MALVVAVSFVIAVAPSVSYASGDDYPYAGLGQCPLVPLPPSHHKPTTPSGPHAPGTPQTPGGPGHGNPHGGPPGNPHTGTPGHPHATTKPGGTTRPTPPPPRVCAKNIWYYNGSYGDPWGFALRNCTSFVAWRLRETNGVADFSNDMDGGHWGNAANWNENAEALGYLVDDVPAVGAVAQTDHGAKGHVAWVESIGDGTVTVEEYNYEVAGGYDVRTVPTSDFRYLHVDDVAPNPNLGSTRAAATVVDARGEAWAARVDASGTLTVRGSTAAHPSTLGARGSWSPTAAPSLAADSTGRVWAVAVSRAGHLFVTHIDPGARRWAAMRGLGSGTWSTTSSPSLVVDGQDRLRLVGVTSAGDLAERHLDLHGRPTWSMPARMGVAGTWATHSAPATVVDQQGRVWVAAVTAGGRLLVRHTVTAGRHWTHLRPVDQRQWSVTSSPAFTSTDSGRLWLAAVDSHGALWVRHSDGSEARWSSADQVGTSTWSPYSSPALAYDDDGRVWLASVDTDGLVVLRWTRDSLEKWRVAGRQVASTATSSPALQATHNGVSVAAVTSAGRPRWLRVGPASGLVLNGPRPGGFFLRLYF